MNIVLTKYVGGAPVEEKLPRTESLRKQFNTILRTLVNSGYSKLAIGTGYFLTDGENSYKLEMV